MLGAEPYVFDNRTPLGGFGYTPRAVMFRRVSHPTQPPITVALVDDYDVVLMGVANMFDQYRDRVVVAEIDANHGCQRRRRHRACTTRSPSRSPTTTRSACWSPTRAHAELWSTPGTFIPTSSTAHASKGAHGYLSKTLPARELVAALEAVHAGEVVVSDAPRGPAAPSGWTGPAAAKGSPTASRRSSALITQGKSNADVAALTYLSPNTVKSYIRTIYRKIDVASRTQGRPLGCRPRLHP